MLFGAGGSGSSRRAATAAATVPTTASAITMSRRSCTDHCRRLVRRQVVQRVQQPQQHRQQLSINSKTKKALATWPTTSGRRPGRRVATCSWRDPAATLPRWRKRQRDSVVTACSEGTQPNEGQLEENTVSAQQIATAAMKPLPTNEGEHGEQPTSEASAEPSYQDLLGVDKRWYSPEYTPLDAKIFEYVASCFRYVLLQEDLEASGLTL